MTNQSNQSVIEFTALDKFLINSYNRWETCRKFDDFVEAGVKWAEDITGVCLGQGSSVDVVYQSIKTHFEPVKARAIIQKIKEKI